MLNYMNPQEGADYFLDLYTRYTGLPYPRADHILTEDGEVNHAEARALAEALQQAKSHTPARHQPC